MQKTELLRAIVYGIHPIVIFCKEKFWSFSNAKNLFWTNLCVCQNQSSVPVKNAVRLFSLTSTVKILVRYLFVQRLIIFTEFD